MDGTVKVYRKEKGEKQKKKKKKKKGKKNYARWGPENPGRSTKTPGIYL